MASLVICSGHQNYSTRSLISVVRSALGDFYFSIVDAINNAVAVINPSTAVMPSLNHPQRLLAHELALCQN